MIIFVCHQSDIGFISYDTICYHELCQNHNKINSTQPCCCYRYLHVKGIFSTERKIQSVVGCAFKKYQIGRSQYAYTSIPNNSSSSIEHIPYTFRALQYSLSRVKKYYIIRYGGS